MMDGEFLYCFWSQVDVQVENGCWDWIGSRSKAGYGRFSYKGFHCYAHRMAWMIANCQEIPNGIVVRHECDRVQCVNPGHLLLGTELENVRDYIERGSILVEGGERRKRALLSESEVIEVKRMLANGYGRDEVVKRLGVKRNIVYSIDTGRTWRWLSANSPGDDMP